MGLANWLGSDAPSGWAEASVRAVKTAVVAFVVLQAKEFFDAGAFDTPATAVDSVLVAAGVFLVNAIQVMVRPKGA